MRFKNKKGNIDILFVVVMLLAFIFVLIIFFKVFTEIGNVLVRDFPNNTVVDTAFGVFGSGQGDKFFTNFNVGFILLFVAGVLGAIVAAFFVETHPVFAVISIVLMIIFTIFAGLISNVYEEFSQVPELSDEFAQFGAVAFFFAHLPKFMLLATALVIIITFSKVRGASGGI